MMSGRAIDTHHWNPDLDVILTEQLLTDFNSDGNSKLNILIAENENAEIVGMMVFNVINSPLKSTPSLKICFWTSL
jgi:BioD-like phosphotransacetylase family protein